MRARLLALTAAALVAALVAAPGSGAAGRLPTLLAGVGRADITPPTGFPLGGWTRADRLGRGVNTRLNASVLLLQRGPKRIALVSVDLFAAPGGMMKAGAWTAQPTEAAVGGEVTFRWQGGERGYDRPLDTPFLTVERRSGGRWRPVADDLGIHMRWNVDDRGGYTGWWDAVDGATPGTHRLVVTARRYRLVSAPFTLTGRRAAPAR